MVDSLNTGEVKSREERATELQSFLDGAIDLARQEEFKGVVTYLDDPEKAEAVGFVLNDTARTFLYNGSSSQEAIKRIAVNVASNSKFKYKADGHGEVTTAGVGPAYAGESQQQVVIPKELWHEVSLIHLEEWLHGLSHLKGVSLAGIDEPEEDVAAYLQEKGVKLTELFGKHIPSKK